MSKTHPIGTILLIDDNAIDQRLCQRLIERSGLVGRFIGFLSAEEALTAFKENRLSDIDAILLDVNMPRMNGFDFLEAATRDLDASFARLVVMMLTTSLDPADQARARQFPVVKDYCSKPLTIDYLQTLAQRLGDSRSP